MVHDHLSIDLGVNIHLRGLTRFHPAGKRAKAFREVSFWAYKRPGPWLQSRKNRTRSEWDSRTWVHQDEGMPAGLFKSHFGLYQASFQCVSSWTFTLGRWVRPGPVFSARDIALADQDEVSIARESQSVPHVVTPGTVHNPAV